MVLLSSFTVRGGTTSRIYICNISAHQACLPKIKNYHITQKKEVGREAPIATRVRSNSARTYARTQLKDMKYSMNTMMSMSMLKLLLAKMLIMLVVLQNLSCQHNNFDSFKMNCKWSTKKETSWRMKRSPVSVQP